MILFFAASRLRILQFFKADCCAGERRKNAPFYSEQTQFAENLLPSKYNAVRLLK
jgi:hypothetical protein